MSPEKDKVLVKTFPKLYADRHASMQTTCMCWGFPGDGWFQLLWDLSEKLERLIEKIPPTCARCGHGPHDDRCAECEGQDSKFGELPRCDEFEPDWPRASQVKEKFGTLRFYMTSETEEMSKLISEAEALSAKTCENCGAPGEVRGGGWLVTLCTDCYTKSKQPSQ